MNDLLSAFSPVDFAASFPSTSRAYIADSLRAGVDPLQLAAELANSPAQGLATKGGPRWPSDLLQRIMGEVHTLLCSDDGKYQTLRDKLRAEAHLTAQVITALVANAVSVSLGLAPALCVPFVALTLAAAVKVGLGAWCQASTPPTSVPS